MCASLVRSAWRCLGITREPPGALVLLVDTMIHSQRVPIVAFAVKYRLPTISPFREFAEAGGLMAHGPQLPDLLAAQSA